MTIQLNKNFYTTYHDHLDLDETRRKYFQGFETREEAEAFALNANKEFMKDYENEQAYYDDLGSPALTVFSREELDLEELEEYLGECFQD